MKVKLIIPASGVGKRHGGSIPKQFIKIGGREIIAHTVEKFHGLKLIDEIVISTKKEFFDKMKTIVRKNNFHKVKHIVEGGKLRQDSVFRGLISLNCKKNDIIMIHDAVRPFISKKKIIQLINEASKVNCVIPGMPINETIKKTGRNRFIEKTISRDFLWTIQTPQLFQYDILRKSFEKSFKDKFIGTDESAIVEHAGYKVKVIEGEKENIKITTRSDYK